MVNGKQLTVTWHVDDLKVSHMDKRVVDAFENWLRANYEDHTPMKPSRGKVHDYLAMEMDYSQPGKLKINMTKYIEGIIENFKTKTRYKRSKLPRQQLIIYSKLMTMQRRLITSEQMSFIPPWLNVYLYVREPGWIYKLR